MLDLETCKNDRQHTRLIYENQLKEKKDIDGFVLEGDARLSFENGCLRMENARRAAEGQKANYVLWCPVDFPSDVLIEWDFLPVREPGLCILFFAAKGRNGEDLFDPSLQKRTGEYQLYHHGDINAFHVSYFRRKEPDERQFHTCNLRKSYGFYLVAQGADPIPDAGDAVDFYHLALYKKGNRICFFVNGLMVFSFEDDGREYGPLLGGGRIGFRQLAPMIGEYRNLKVYALTGERGRSSQKIYEQIVEMARKKHGNITMEECCSRLNYHPSYIWKVLKKQNTTFSSIIEFEMAAYARDQLVHSEKTIAELAQELGYSNTQNFIRSFSKSTGMTPGMYREEGRKTERQ